MRGSLRDIYFGRGSATLLGVAMALLVLSGCNTVGPKALRGGRIDYNSAIAYTAKEQLLLNLVRARYGEAPLFLEVSSVSTQYNLALGAEINPLWERSGIRSATRTVTSAGAATLTRNRRPSTDDEYKHNANINYYERPTISYAPLQGEAFVRNIMSPIPADALILLSESGWSLQRIMLICVQRLNGLPNAPSASGPTPSYVPRYTEFAEMARLMREMQLAHGMVAVSHEVDGGRGVAIKIAEHIQQTPMATEWKKLLGLPDDQFEFPLVFAWEAPEAEHLAIQTRSMYGVLSFLSNGVEVPEAHMEAGWVTDTRTESGEPFDWDKVTGDVIHIRSSATRPHDASVSVRYEGAWFYIAKSDVNSKSTFTLISLLFNLQSGDVNLTRPTLTLPVGG
ncbi:MAG: hypothetical protein L3K26_05245 [Candidatus Hydrogenedentes bacterium]|nr:hypothetical protein [Candidatus Hydrogenedentota bacterium]